MIRHVKIPLFLMLLTSCAHTNTCLPLKTWSAADQDTMEAQLDMVPDGSPLMLAVEDYARLRKATIACQALQ